MPLSSASSQQIGLTFPRNFDLVPHMTPTSVSAPQIEAHRRISLTPAEAAVRAAYDAFEVSSGRRPRAKRDEEAGAEGRTSGGGTGGGGTAVEEATGGIPKAKRKNVNLNFPSHLLHCNHQWRLCPTLSLPAGMFCPHLAVTDLDVPVTGHLDSSDRALRHVDGTVTASVFFEESGAPSSA